MGFVSNSLNFGGLGYQGKHQIYFLFGPFDFGHLPTKKKMCPIYQHQQILCCNICLKLGYPQS